MSAYPEHRPKKKADQKIFRRKKKLNRARYAAPLYF